MARCRFRGDDGVTRVIERRTPTGQKDQHGAAAEAALLAAIEQMRTPVDSETTGDTSVMALCRKHIHNLEENGRAALTIDAYNYALGKLEPRISGLRVREATAGRVNNALQALRTNHGATIARNARTILRGALQLAVNADAIERNPVDQVQRIESTAPRKGAPAVPAELLVRLLIDIRTSAAPFNERRTLAEYCRDVDLADLITMFVGTGMRRSELLGLRWVDIDDEASVAHVHGKVVRIAGVGLVRQDTTKTAASARTIPLPTFVMDMLKRRSTEPHPNEYGVIFPNTRGNLRDPNDFGAQWRKVRELFALPDVTSHSFRKAVATLIDDAALSARIGADHLGHRNVSMTMDKYFGRGRQHPEVAALLDQRLSISDE
ncbi:tyrosine recombinase XerC [Nocardia farcinica]|uniref:tyrosine recombinase XerC n=1 Tax=Nocardia farcinica TaxID=37329 RepID=UPI0037A3750C